MSARACMVFGFVTTLATATWAQAPVAPPFVAPVAPIAPIAPTVKITLVTVPVQKRVFVLWGKKRLGLIAPHQPLIIQRPRDSGPLDLIFQCDGFVPVQTRAYTFGDSKVAVKLTPLDQKNTLLGYREEVPPEAAPAPDGGVPPALPPPVPALPPPGIAAPPPALAPTPKAGPDAGVR